MVIFICDKPVNRVSLNYKAVSYTHLDVYKRQTIDRKKAQTGRRNIVKFTIGMCH